MDTETPPSSHAYGVDLSDFASPSPQTKPQNYGGLPGVQEDDDEDNIPGAKAIRVTNGNGGGSRGNYTATHAANPAKPTKQLKSPANTNVSKPTGNNKNAPPRRLADTKPCSYPNLLITRSGDTTATSNGHHTSGNISNATTPGAASATTITPAPDSVSVSSVNSSGSSSAHSKSHNHRHHHHLHRQVSSGSNNKESKCSVM